MVLLPHNMPLPDEDMEHPDSLSPEQRGALANEGGLLEFHWGKAPHYAT